MNTITYSAISSLCETCFPLQKIKGYLYQFLQVSKWVKNFQISWNRVPVPDCTQYGLQRFNHGLNSGNVQYRPITQACLTSEWHHMLFESFSHTDVNVFALSVHFWCIWVGYVKLYHTVVGSRSTLLPLHQSFSTSHQVVNKFVQIVDRFDKAVMWLVIWGWYGIQF